VVRETIWHSYENVSSVVHGMLTGVADATDWTYWSHLESLLKSMPSSTQTLTEEGEEEESSDQFMKEVETVYGMETFHLWLIVA
jgi:hypothetical protein